MTFDEPVTFVDFVSLRVARIVLAVNFAILSEFYRYAKLFLLPRCLSL